jgi:hypothetical protein
VFTNVLTEGEQIDRDIVARLSALAARRGHPYVPVYVRCETEENLRRVPAAERHERMKWVDPDAVRRFVDEHVLFRFDDRAPFEVDTTALAPDDAARQVLDHIAGL